MQDPAPTSSIFGPALPNEGKIDSTRDRPKRASFTNSSYIGSFGNISEQNRTKSASDSSCTAEAFLRTTVLRESSTIRRPTVHHSQPIGTGPRFQFATEAVRVR